MNNPTAEPPPAHDLAADQVRELAAAPVPKAYVVFDLEITDPSAYEAYRHHGQASTRRWGGRVLTGEPAPRGLVESLEGTGPRVAW